MPFPHWLIQLCCFYIYLLIMSAMYFPYLWLLRYNGSRSILSEVSGVWNRHPIQMIHSTESIHLIQFLYWIILFRFLLFSQTNHVNTQFGHLGMFNLVLQGYCSALGVQTWKVYRNSEPAIGETGSLYTSSHKY